MIQPEGGGLRPRDTRRSKVTSLLIVGLTMVPLALAGPSDHPAANGCPTDPDAAKDLHCIELLPAHDAPDAEGRAELRPPESPFGVAVSETGAPRHQVRVELRGLPDPASLGPYEAYVAWATTPRLDPVIRLGEVSNGANDLGTLALNRFILMVTAEESSDVSERDGRIVLRGGSPSYRLHPHDFAAFLSTAASPRGEDPADSGGDTAPESPDGPTDRGWIVPTMPPEVPAVPGLSALRPSARPFLPDFEAAELPVPLPTRVVRLEDGDTLDLRARPVRQNVGGRTFVAYAYNGRIPGPLIRVDQGAEIMVVFRNLIDLPTTVHWHGIRLRNPFDGVPGVTQEPVEPGGEFVYRVRFPDAGLYWYHPHIREDVQQDLGLYGNLWVEPEEPDYFGPVNREEVLVLDDILLGESGPIPWGRESATHAMMGRFGNEYLVNGTPGWRMKVRRGEVVRFYMTNVSNTRVFHLTMENAEMKAVATDMGRFPEEVRVDGAVLAPAERFIVEVRFPESGTFALTNRVQGVNHSYGSFYSDVDTLGMIEVGEEPVPRDEDHGEDFERLRAHPALQAAVDRLGPWREREPDRRLLLTMETSGLPFPLGPMMRADSTYFSPVEWTGSMAMGNWVSTGREVRWILRDPHTGRENLDIDWRFSVGDSVKIKIVNDRDAFHAMQHPIHLHGQRFMVLTRNGVPQRNPAWKDTFLLPAGSTAEILLELSNPGRWMIHCHISEHLEAQMKAIFTVDSSSTAVRPRDATGVTP